ncbi:MAG: protein translocase subunit SecF [Bdellovibrionota bacterium]
MSEKKTHKFFTVFPENPNIDFARQRFFWLAVSLALIAGSFVMYKARGLQYGIEFAGGADIQVKFDEAVATEDVRKALEDGKIEGASVQTIEESAKLDIEKGLTVGLGAGAASPEFLIKVKGVEGEDIADTAKRTRTALEAKFGPSRTAEQPTGKWEVRRQESASPSAVAELTKKGMDSIFYSTILIFLYIVVRFAQVDWASAVGYGVGAVIATAHDLLVIFAAFTYTGKEVTLPVVAGVLTVIGYSINDTIVVYDRIRENYSRNRSRELWETINKSVNETLSRTVITGCTTFLVILSLMFLGGSVIHDFAYTLFIGILTGTYSSIFVASPIFVWTTKAIHRFQKSRAGTLEAKTPRV